MNLKDDLPTGERAPDSFNVVVEIPKGSQNKYEYDVNLQTFVLDRVLFSPLHYPGDYGFIPQTLATDNDPMDALVLVSFPTYPGMVIHARPIGIMKFNDSGEQDDKILCVPENDIRYESTLSIKDVPQPILNEIAHFFTVYKELEGKKAVVEGWEDIEHAKEVLIESMERYQGKAA